MLPACTLQVWRLPGYGPLQVVVPAVPRRTSAEVETELQHKAAVLKTQHGVYGAQFGGRTASLERREISAMVSTLKDLKRQAAERDIKATLQV